MAAARKLILTHAGSHVEVDAAVAARRGALRLLAREAEEKLGLSPNSYRFRDGHGTVKSPEALQRALGTVGSGDCFLEVRETLQGKIARAVEKSVLAKVDARLADMEKSIMAQVEDRLTALTESQKQTEADAQSELRTLVQQALPAHADGLAQRCAAATLQALSAQVEALAQKCEAAAQELPLEPPAPCAAAAGEASACWQDNHGAAGSGRSEIAGLAPSVAAAGASWAKPKHAPWAAARPEPKAGLAGIPYSAKGALGAWRVDGEAVPPPFAPGGLLGRPAAHPGRGMPSCRSLPLLPPLR